MRRAEKRELQVTLFPVKEKRIRYHRRTGLEVRKNIDDIEKELRFDLSSCQHRQYELLWMGSTT